MAMTGRNLVTETGNIHPAAEAEHFEVCGDGEMQAGKAPVVTGHHYVKSSLFTKSSISS